MNEKLAKSNSCFTNQQILRYLKNHNLKNCSTLKRIKLEKKIAEMFGSLALER